MNLDIEIDGWPGPTDWAEVAERALEAAENVAPELGNQRLSASVLFTVDKEVRALNREWRMKDAPTNVLSFPMMERTDLLSLAPDGGPEMLRDIADAVPAAGTLSARCPHGRADGCGPSRSETVK